MPPRKKKAVVASKMSATELLNAVNTKLGTNAVFMGSDNRLTVEYFSTGYLPFDILLQGGVPRGRMIEIYGDWCLAPETLVLTADYKWVPLGDIRKHDKLIGFDEHAPGGRGRQRGYRQADVERVGRKHLPSFRVETDRGTSTVASVNHKWLVLNKAYKRPEWKLTQDLEVGDSILYFGDTWDELTDPSDREAAAYLAGLYDGEGWYDHGRISFGQNPGSVLDRGCELLDQLGFNYSVSQQNSSRENYNVHRVSLLASMRDRMRFMGQVRPVRLLEKFVWDGKSISSKGPFGGIHYATVTKVKDVGVKEVVTIKTSTNTLIADGMFTHNSVLKSVICLSTAAQVQAQGGTVALLDTEHAYEPQWAAKLGVDTSELIVWPPRDDDEEHTGEEAIDVAQVLCANKVDLVIFDSVAAATPQAETTKRLKGESV